MSKHPFRTEFRLCAPTDFNRVFRGPERRRVSAAHLVLHAHGNGLTHPRLGIRVSRRVSKSAVCRNRIKRLIREQFRHRLARLPALDIVVVCRPVRGGAADDVDWPAGLASAWCRLAPPEDPRVTPHG